MKHVLQTTTLISTLLISITLLTAGCVGENSTNSNGMVANSNQVNLANANLAEESQVELPQLPGGGWLDSCDKSSAQWDGINLSANCQFNSQYTESTPLLNYAGECSSGSNVENIYGVLQCDTFSRIPSIFSGNTGTNSIRIQIPESSGITSMIITLDSKKTSPDIDLTNFPTTITLYPGQIGTLMFNAKPIAIEDLIARLLSSSNSVGEIDAINQSSLTLAYSVTTNYTDEEESSTTQNSEIQIFPNDGAEIDNVSSNTSLLTGQSNIYQNIEASCKQVFNSAMPLPDGPWQQQGCSVSHWDGATLQATCNNSATSVTSSINYAAMCKDGGVKFDGSKLVCVNDNFPPQGNYMQTCDTNSINWNGYVLTAKCNNQLLSVHYNQCPNNSIVNYVNNQLVCMVPNDPNFNPCVSGGSLKYVKADVNDPSKGYMQICDKGNGVWYLARILKPNQYVAAPSQPNPNPVAPDPSVCNTVTSSTGRMEKVLSFNYPKSWPDGNPLIQGLHSYSQYTHQKAVDDSGFANYFTSLIPNAYAGIVPIAMVPEAAPLLPIAAGIYGIGCALGIQNNMRGQARSNSYCSVFTQIGDDFSDMVHFIFGNDDAVTNLPYTVGIQQLPAWVDDVWQQSYINYFGVMNLVDTGFGIDLYGVPSLGMRSFDFPSQFIVTRYQNPPKLPMDPQPKRRVTPNVDELLLTRDPTKDTDLQVGYMVENFGDQPVLVKANLTTLYFDANGNSTTVGLGPLATLSNDPAYCQNNCLTDGVPYSVSPSKPVSIILNMTPNMTTNSNITTVASFNVISDSMDPVGKSQVYNEVSVPTGTGTAQ